jgi:hypothetical protein
MTQFTFFPTEGWESKVYSTFLKFYFIISFYYFRVYSILTSISTHPVGTSHISGFTMRAVWIVQPFFFQYWGLNSGPIP